MFKIKRNLFSAKIIQIVILFEVMKMTMALKCYVCGDPSNFLYDSNKNVNSTSNQHLECVELNRHWNSTKILNDIELNKFIIECPENYQGCTTQIQDNHITRSCDIFPIDDCQIANGIKYCYCNSNLCNGSEENARIQQLEKSYQQRSKSSVNYYNMPDDEDYERDSEDDDGFEMSGNGENDDFNEYKQSIKTKEITSSTAKNQDKYFMEKLKNIIIASSNNNTSISSSTTNSYYSSTMKSTNIPIIYNKTTTEKNQDEIILKDNIEHKIFTISNIPLNTTTKSDTTEMQTERTTTTVRNRISFNNNKSQYDDDDDDDNRENKNSANKYKLDFKLIILFVSLSLYHIIY